MQIERKKKFRIYLLAVVIFLLSGTLFSSPSNSSAQYPDLEKKFSKGLSEKLKFTSPDEKVKVIITLKKPGGKFEAQASRSSVRKDILLGGGKVKREYSIFEGMAAEISTSKIKALANNPNVELIVEDRQFKAFLTESVPLINADDVWNKTYAGANITGKGQTVCVIDTGVYYNHSDLGGGKGVGFKVLGGYDFVNNNDDPLDDNGHGTHVAGIIAANGTLKGVAPDASIIAIKALDASGLGSESDILAGIDWCVSNANAYNITVISMSLGSGSYTSYCDNTEMPFRDSINTAVANNMTVVVSTGNDASSTAIGSPACIQNAIRVGATYDSNVGGITWPSAPCTDDTTSTDKITCFTNRGANFPDLLLAPGALIYSTWKSNVYSNEGGTSMATPHVSGLIALLNQEYKAIYGTNPTPSYIFDIMNSTGVSIYDSVTVKNYSRIDALAAYNAIYSFSVLYSDDLDDDGDNWDNNFTASYNTSSNTPVWNISANKINLTDANTGEGKLIIVASPGLLYDGNGDYDLKDVNAGDDYVLYNGIYIIDGNAGIIQLTYEPIFNTTYSNGDGNMNAGEVILIKGSNYVITDNETLDQNITLGPAIAKTLNATTAHLDNATLISGTNKILYNGSYLYFYYESSEVDSFNATGKIYPYEAASGDVNSGEFIVYTIYVLFANSSEAKVTMVNKSKLMNLTNNNESAFGYNNTKINDSAFPKVNEIVLLSANVSLEGGKYVNVLGTYFSIYFDENKTLDIFRRNTTPPAITSGPTASSITTSTATITWNTDEASNSTVEYGTNTSYGSLVGSSNLVTSHSMSLTGLSSSTTYHYRVISSDSLRNIVTSGDYNFTTSTPTIPPTGGGGGGSVNKNRITKYIKNLGPDDTDSVVFDSKKSPYVSEIVITVSAKVYNAKISLETLDKKPSPFFSDPAGLILSYFKITTSNILAGSLEKAEIKFRVEKNWLIENDINKDKVILKREEKKNWGGLPTVRIRKENKSEYFYYSAESPDFSYFVITGEGGSGYVEKKVSVNKTAVQNETIAPMHKQEETIPDEEIIKELNPTSNQKEPRHRLQWVIGILILFVICSALYINFIKNKSNHP